VKHVRRLSSAVGLAVATLLTLLLATPAAAAAVTDPVSPSVTPTGSNVGPMALATTGLDITVPVVIGLTTLVLGIAVVGWAFLRTGSAQQRD
jgi:hypothetical protein